MRIDEAKHKAAGTTVKDLAVVVTTAGKTEQVDKTLPKKQSKQAWEQKLGLTDDSGHIWAILPTQIYNPVVKGHSLVIKDAMIDEFRNKGGEDEKRLLIGEHELPAVIGEPPVKQHSEGVLDPIVEDTLSRYAIAATEALYPFTRYNKQTNKSTTTWIIFHRYCEQIAAKAGIVIDPPAVVKDGPEEVVLFITGRLGHAKEWTYGEASTKNTQIPYLWSMAEKRGKDRIILKLAGFHGMVYSEFETE